MQQQNQRRQLLYTVVQFCSNYGSTLLSLRHVTTGRTSDGQQTDDEPTSASIAYLALRAGRATLRLLENFTNHSRSLAVLFG